MSKLKQETLASGVFKTYYNVKNEFVAVGTFLTDRAMYYTAAHPTKGLWISGIAGNNDIMPIGFIDWANINRIVIDRDGEYVFVVPHDFNSAFSQMSVTFRKVYKKAWTHKMSDTGEMAFVLPLYLWSGNIISYLENFTNVIYQSEKVHVSFWLKLFYIILIISFVGAVLSKIIKIMF